MKKLSIIGRELRLLYEHDIIPNKLMVEETIVLRAVRHI